MISVHYGTLKRKREIVEYYTVIVLSSKELRNLSPVIETKHF